MGLYMSMYVGPYAEATAEPSEREVDVYGCTNSKCAQWKKRETWMQAALSSFCATCGTATGKTTKLVKGRPSPHEALGESERLSSIRDDEDEDVVYFVPNIRGSVGLRLNGDRGASHHVDLAGVDREAEMALFEGQFPEELSALRKVYDVKTCWGLQVDWS